LWNSCRFISEFIYGQEKDDSHLAKEDRWLISRTNSLIASVTEALEKHDYHICIQQLKSFVNDDLWRWYIKLVRERSSQKDPALAYTLSYVVDSLSRLLAPFAPYISEEIYQTFVKEKESVHLDSWPEKGKTDALLEERMDEAREMTQAILSAREALKRGIRWPVQESIIVTKDEKTKSAVREFADIIKQQTNTKKLVLTSKFERAPEGYASSPFRKGEAYVSRALTEELEAEGYSREIIRRVQQLRKTAGLKKADKVDVVIKLPISLKEKLSSFYTQIKERIGAENFGMSVEKPEKDFSTASKARIKEQEFEIFLEKKQ
jgi:isoleucyl-tRNA synthetase